MEYKEILIDGHVEKIAVKVPIEYNADLFCDDKKDDNNLDDTINLHNNLDNTVEIEVGNYNE